MIKKLIVLASLLGISSLSCDRHEPTAEANNDAFAVASAPQKDRDAVSLPDSSSALVGLKVEKVKTQGVRSVLMAMGKILACRPKTAIVTYAFPARVATIEVSIGDWVEKGQALISLESRDVGNALSEYYKARASLDLAKVNLDREASLLADGVGVKKNYVTAEGDHKIAQANMEATEKSLHVLGFTEKDVEEVQHNHRINPTITLYAPISGKVVKLNTVHGSIVDETTEILTIIDPAVLWADAEVYEKDIAKIEVGQDAEVTVPAYPGKIFHGKTTYVADLVDEETRTIAVRTELANGNHGLKPGMFAEVAIVLHPDEQMVVVPSGAVLEDGDQKIVFVKEKDNFLRRDVETRPAEGNMLPVVKGLAPGELVVVEGNHELNSKLREGVLKATHTH